MIYCLTCIVFPSVLKPWFSYKITKKGWSENKYA